MSATNHFGHNSVTVFFDVLYLSLFASAAPLCYCFIAPSHLQSNSLLTTSRVQEGRLEMAPRQEQG